MLNHIFQIIQQKSISELFYTLNNNSQSNYSYKNYMHKLENIALRKTNQYLSKSNAFLRIRIKALEKNKNKHSCSLLQELTIDMDTVDKEKQNKALYLEYVGSVLSKKQESLLQWEQRLQNKENLLNKDAYDKQIAQKIKLVADMKAIQTRMFAIGQKIMADNLTYEQYRQQFQTIHNQARIRCQEFKQEMEMQFKTIYDEVTTEQIMLRNKISQYTQLSSYQKYLNELHDALEARNLDLAQDQEKIKSLIAQNESKNDNSSKKRHKIFDRKSNNNSKLSQQLVWGQNQTFAEGQIHNISSHPKHQEKSSQIMDENDNMHSFNPSSIERNNFSHNKNCDQQLIVPPYHAFNRQKEFKEVQHYEQQPRQIVLISKGIQFDTETSLNTAKRLNQQALILKYLKLWIKLCMHKNQTISKKKLFATYLLRANTIFDETIPEKFISQMKHLEQMWGKKRKALMHSNLLPYSELSLKRKKYQELFLEHQMKRNHRTQVHRTLTSILRNRNRKQRLVFYFYFIRFYKNCLSANKSLSTNKVLSNKEKIIVNSSNKAVKDDKSHESVPRVNKTTSKKSITPKKSSEKFNRSSKSSLTPYQQQHSLKHLHPSNMSSSSITNKQNNVHLQTKQSQIIELKKYIENKQRIQKLLATQCVKLEGMIKMVTVFSGIGYKTNSQFFRRLFEKNFENKIESLSTQMNSLEFKFELIVTKCRLGLASNNNKLSTLQNLLGFTNFIK